MLKLFNKLFALSFSFFVSFCFAAEDPDIGKVIIAKGSVEAERQQQTFPLKRKSKVFSKDQVSTGDNSRSQFRLADGSIFTLGENSKIIIDKYLYSPGEQNSAAFELVTGVFRAVTGKITEVTEPDFKVKTPLGSIGIRGTDFWGGYLDENKIDVIMLSGERNVIVSNEFGSVEIREPGFGTTIEPGKAPTVPERWTTAKVTRAAGKTSVNDP